MRQQDSSARSVEVKWKFLEGWTSVGCWHKISWPPRLAPTFGTQRFEFPTLRKPRRVGQPRFDLVQTVGQTLPELRVSGAPGKTSHRRMSNALPRYACLMLIPHIY